MAFLGIFGVLTLLAIIVVIIAGVWKTFEKAGQPGWAVIVPVYNYYIMTQIAKKPGYWTIFLLIPYVNIVFLILINLEIAKLFNKSTGFGIGLTFLSFIFYPMLGFSDATYMSEETDIEAQIDEIGR